MRDIVIAYFKTSCSNGIRLVKRNDNFFIKGDLFIGYRKDYKEQRRLVTKDFIIEFITTMIDQTLRGKDECCEIWINKDFNSIVLGD